MSAARSVSTVLTLILAIASLLGGMVGASAHEIRPALLEIEERQPGLFDVVWKVPVRGDAIPDIQPVFPAFMEQIGRTTTEMLPGTKLERSTYNANGKPIVGETLRIDRLSTMQIDVLVRLSLADGSTHSTILRPDTPSFLVPVKASKSEVAWSYWRMGMVHILEGVDHLLFVLALLILITNFWNLLKTVTAFTVAHSLTLALASLGMVNVPPAPTEAIIALSIVFLAAEILRKYAGETTLTMRYPWAVACFFGLFHGLGFAGALTNIGLPAHEIPLALLMFNVGVETGQILFIVTVVALLELLRRIAWPLPEGARQLVPYAIGGIAAFWTIERVASFVQLST
ncbi:MAG: HupE/UreJ family protein [Geminicoccaceae bacterium]